MYLLPEGFEERLNTKIIGHPLYVYSQLDSTQRRAKYLAEKGTKEGSVVLAYSQEEGVGKNEREWFSPLGGIWFTVILRPPLPYLKISRIMNPMFTVAIAEVLLSFKAPQPLIKWPNDILINGKKICGILTQIKTKPQEQMNPQKNSEICHIEYALVGVGINLNIEKEKVPSPLNSKITSVQEELGKKVRMEDFFGVLLERLDRYYLDVREGSFDKIQKEWEKFSLPFGLLVKASNSKNSYYGQVVGIADEGHLLIRGIHGTLEKLLGGEIELI